MGVHRLRDIYVVIRRRIVYIFIPLWRFPPPAGWITNVIPNGIRGGVPLKFSFDRRFVIPPEEIPFGEAIKFYDVPNESVFFPPFFFNYKGRAWDKL